MREPQCFSTWRLTAGDLSPNLRFGGKPHAKRVGAPKVRCGFSPASAGMEKATAGSEASRSTEGALQAPHCFSTCRSVTGFAWLDRTDSKQALALAVHCSIWWMSRCDGRVLEKNFMKTYCVRLAASAGAPENVSRVEFLRQKIKKPTMIRDFFKNPEVQVELAA